jgi:hypothetical protein
MQMPQPDDGDLKRLSNSLWHEILASLSAKQERHPSHALAPTPAPALNLALNPALFKDRSESPGDTDTPELLFAIGLLSPAERC